MKKTLGIIGGMGSWATCHFYHKILQRTNAKCDQENLDMVILNHASIPDRTAYCIENGENSPYEYICEDIKKLEKLGCCMISIPCNTACCFYEKLQSITNIPISNIIYNTAEYLYKNNINEITLLATDGTIKSKIYQKYCDKFNIKVHLLDNNIQNKVMKLIYDYIKIGKKDYYNIWCEIQNNIKTKYIVLGCTELSILKNDMNLGDEYVDSLEVEANKIIEYMEE